MNSVIYFPVKSYILKYLQFRYGPQFLYTQSSSLAPIIRSVLSKETVNFYKPFSNKLGYPVELTDLYVSRYGVFFNQKKLYQFNNDVDNLFREELFQFMNLNKDIYNIKYRVTLRDFLNRMDITEDDIKIGTLLKSFTRNQEDSNKNTKDNLTEKKYVHQKAS